MVLSFDLAAGTGVRWITALGLALATLPLGFGAADGRPGAGLAGPRRPSSWPWP